MICDADKLTECNAASSILRKKINLEDCSQPTSLLLDGIICSCAVYPEH